VYFLLSQTHPIYLQNKKFNWHSHNFKIAMTKNARYSVRPVSLRRATTGCSTRDDDRWREPLGVILPAQLFAYHLTRVEGYNTEQSRSIRKVAEMK
jgi:hypothetical protein